MEVGPKFILQHLDEGIDQWQGFAVLGSTVATSHEDPAWIAWIMNPRWLAEYDSMNPSLSPNSRMPVRALADRHVARTRHDWWPLDVAAQCSEEQPQTPHGKGGEGLSESNTQRFLARMAAALLCANKKHKEGSTTIRSNNSDNTKKTVEDMQLHPHPCQIHNVIAATVLKVVSTVGNSTIRYHESLTLGDIFKSCFWWGKNSFSHRNPRNHRWGICQLPQAKSQPLGTTEPNCGPNVKPQRNTALTMMSGRHRQ